ncbi:hypothetical protein B0H66DRAFT_482999 [Apodospora peruviana]|uniref:Homeobox domain-containing protein n=1 Tax=Apodospora peruviana TaxID=516989 RepID=A0AAE0HV36_9PEZI|nr:hypothetical protein B0H66DRAFT_482999 [Apodospora peruviana]
MLHWKCDDLFVLPELEDLEKCLREDYCFETDIFAIPSENAHLELMLKLGDMIKNHESEDTLFVVYYGGHARIDESRQSTWCATRRPGSPWLQWSAIQTLLERSVSDALILLDCCAGAASATFPTGQSITETISASSWDAIAPDPGRYSFTNALIEVLQEWRLRTFSAAMLHAEVLARLKHPRPILINGKHFEARTTPVHFMMTSNHKAPSIEIGRLVPNSRRPPSPLRELGFHSHATSRPRAIEGRNAAQTLGSHSDVMIPVASEPNENEPHVMISLALEDDQRLDLNSWEEWLSQFPAIAKHVKVQGVFKSHSTLLLLSLPVMVWDLLPDDPACAFVAFIRSNNLLRAQDKGMSPGSETTTAVGNVNLTPGLATADGDSMFSGTTFTPDELKQPARNRPAGAAQQQRQDVDTGIPPSSPPLTANAPQIPPADNFVTMTSPILLSSPAAFPSPLSNAGSSASLSTPQTQHTASSTLSGIHDSIPTHSRPIPRTMILNQTRSSRKMTFDSGNEVPDTPRLAKHVVNRLEEFFHKETEPDVAITEYLASNLGVESSDVHRWFHHRREQERTRSNLQGLRLTGYTPEAKGNGARMILPGHLNTLLEIYPSRSVLIIDLRSSTDFDRSHIHEAVNLRAPLSFIQHTSLEMIEDTLVDDESRRRFCKWFQSRCVVFYDRVIEFDWECPVADALYEKFKKKGWLGQCFILKGHYREFSTSFDKYISGSKMSKEAKLYLDGLRQRSSPTQDEANQRHERYDSWLKAFESEDRVPVVELVPAKKAERIRGVEQRQKELEVEFETRFPALYRKAKAMRPRQPSIRRTSLPPDSPYSAATTLSPIVPPPPPFEATVAGSSSQQFGQVSWGTEKEKQQQQQEEVDDEAFDMTRAPLVGHLASGLDKMREAAASAAGGGVSPPVAAPSPLITPGAIAGTKVEYTDKMLEHAGYSSPPPGLDDYDEIDPKTEGLRNDPAFQRAGQLGYGVGPLGQQDVSSAGGSTTSVGSAGGGDKKSGGSSGSASATTRKRPQLWDRLRSGGK